MSFPAHISKDGAVQTVAQHCRNTAEIAKGNLYKPGLANTAYLYWWKHNCKDGQYSSAKVHRLVTVSLKEEITQPTSVDDYVIVLRQHRTID